MKEKNGSPLEVVSNFVNESQRVVKQHWRNILLAVLGTNLLNMVINTPVYSQSPNIPNAPYHLYFPKVIVGDVEVEDPNQTECYGEIAPLGSDFLNGQIVPLQVAAEGAWRGKTWADQEGCGDLSKVQKEGNIVINSMEVQCFNTNGRTPNGEYIDPVAADCEVVTYYDRIWDKPGLAVTIPYTEDRTGVAIEIKNSQVSLDPSLIGVQSLDDIKIDVREDTTISWNYD